MYKLDPERLYATYFGGDDKQGLPSDEEARMLWCPQPVLPPSRPHTPSRDSSRCTAPGPGNSAPLR